MPTDKHHYKTIRKELDYVDRDSTTFKLSRKAAHTLFDYIYLEKKNPDKKHKEFDNIKTLNLF